MAIVVVGDEPLYPTPCGGEIGEASIGTMRFFHELKIGFRHLLLSYP